MRLAFDSRPTADPQGLGRYSRGLLQALHDTAGEHDEILESHRPRGADLFHAPWVQGAMLHSPCPMVVTLYDIAALKRPSERLRGGGMHLHLRHLALQRASHVIVPSEVVAREAVAEFGLERERMAVIPEAPDTATPMAGRSAELAPLTTWTWEDAARETWRVYRRALAHPHRPCVTAWRRPLNTRRVVSAPQGSSSAGS
ncbi:MAG TPA: glycosyltransferase [Solirubrobacteraceae bacterium]|nr:glycosyltransferase [Solirubrobacteraceae bacterium]